MRKLFLAVAVMVALCGCENGSTEIVQHVDKEHGVVCYQAWGSDRISCVKVKGE